MSFAGYELTGVRSLRVTSWSLVGIATTEVESVDVEIDYGPGDQRLVTISFGENPPNIATVEALIRAMNQKLGN